MIRFATLEDQVGPLFAGLIEDSHKLGGEILPLQENVEVYCRIAEAYIRGKLEGVCLVADEGGELAGILLWGEGGPNPFKTSWGRTAMAWGTYVAPGYRGRGLSTALRKDGARWLRFYNFDTAAGSAVDTNVPGIASGLGSGGFRRHGVVGILELR